MSRFRRFHILCEYSFISVDIMPCFPVAVNERTFLNCHGAMSEEWIFISFCNTSGTTRPCHSKLGGLLFEASSRRPYCVIFTTLLACRIRRGLRALAPKPGAHQISQTREKLNCIHSRFLSPGHGHGKAASRPRPEAGLALNTRINMRRTAPSPQPELG